MPFLAKLSNKGGCGPQRGISAFINFGSIGSALSNDCISALKIMSWNKIVISRGAVFREGDEADKVFCVSEGLIKLVKTSANGNQCILGLLFAPMLLGLCLGQRHTYSAEAI